MAGSSFLTRKCLGLEAAKSVAFSRIGPSTGLPSASESNTSAHKDGNNTPLATIVVAATVSALLCLCILVLVLRNIQRRQSVGSDTSVPSVDAPEDNPERTNLWKSREGQEEEEKAGNEGAGGRRSVQRVQEQLVVMAGEDTPTFLAHSVPATSPAACNVHIHCPPLHL